MMTARNKRGGTASLYEQLRAAILNGEWKPGTPLIEAAVAEMFGVSRTPVREVLRRLEHDGIIQQNGRQLVIRVTTAEEVIEIYDCRIILEGMAAEWAAKNRTEYDLAVLEGALNAMEQLKEHVPSDMARTNSIFHELLWRASHNATLFDLLRRLEMHTLRYAEPTVSQPGRWSQAVDDHAAILTAIRERDTQLARKLAVEHMAAAQEIRLRMLRDSAPGQATSLDR